MSIIQNCPWENLVPATMKFCESNLCSIITQPANALSSIIYVFIGIFLFLKYKKEDIRKDLVIIPFVAILLGITSFLYHASYSFNLQIFDLLSMFLLSSYLIVANLKRMKLIRGFYFNFLILFLIQASLFLIIKSKSGAVIFGIAIIFSIFLEIKLFSKEKSTKYLFYLLALATLVSAFIFWILDYSQIICNPDNHLINGHSLWHIINSLSIIFIYKFYKQFN
jgi:hypothetical protein